MTFACSCLAGQLKGADTRAGLWNAYLSPSPAWSKPSGSTHWHSGTADLLLRSHLQDAGHLRDRGRQPRSCSIKIHSDALPIFTLTSEQPVALLVRRYCSLAAAVEGEFLDHSGILKQNSVQELQLVL
eukprot:CAMPEP_0171551196 /NCGR_PEP_ID=MMETSP0960-20121227/7549_1 /TAXON_ID=87120 /ORGANISM="Aurantiochytrium limacinum, Strain ATCCMYA-1381" /LENGTH=127 /DNA_ID=CAMNT_0012100343 /DNA_START=963 /DNA_END=1346 /DNA_ORIENTATION=-